MNIIAIMQETPTFIVTLRKLKRSWQWGLILGAKMRLAGGAAVAFAVYALADFFLAFDPWVCLTLDLVLLAVLLGLLVLWLAGIFRLTDRDMACRADALLHNRRRIVLSGLELHEWLRQGHRRHLLELQIYLSQMGVETAGAELRRLMFRDYFPFAELRRRLKVLVLQLAVVSLLGCLNPAATRVIAERIVFPLRDTPPYSLYAFAVAPASPRVIYGGTAEVTVEITGAPVKADVWFVTRYRGQTHRTACFQESGLRFAQRLEKVVSPVEFCFAVGTARSRWHKVDLLLQPEIANAYFTILPPAYTGLPIRQSVVGKEELAGYRQSRIELFVTSNRPLIDGLLTVHPKGGLGDERSVKGIRCSPTVVSFSWPLLEEAELDVTIRDIRGTRNATPFRIQQKIIPDKPPETMITDPAAFSLATPSVTLPLAGTISDDLSVRKVDLVRTVVGYRDRMLLLGPQEPAARVDFNRKLDLKALGAAPGQMLEFYLEAADSNPAMTGVTASEIVRVQIISEDEYAAMLRAKTTLAEFVERYRLMDAELRRYIEALQKLKRAAAGQNAAEIEKAQKEARDMDRQVSDLLRKMASDFPIFDTEKTLGDAMKDILSTLADQDSALGQMKAPYSGVGKAVDNMLKELGVAQQQLKDQTVTAEEIALVARVMECAARFKDLVRQQAELVRRLDRFDKEPSFKDVRLLTSLGRRQDEVRTELVKLVSDLQERAGKLPPDYDALRNSALKFAELIGVYEIPDLMKKGVTAADNQDGKEAFRYATLALEKLKELMSNCSGTEFGGLCDGKITFSVSDDLKSTMQQMLSAIMGQKGGGSGKGRIGMAGGGMIGGDQNDGYSTGGYSPLNVPIAGPRRTSFGGGDTGTTGTGPGSGRGSPSGVHTTGTEGLDRKGSTEVKSESLPIEQVPEKYRNAIKKYFSSEEKPK